MEPLPHLRLQACCTMDLYPKYKGTCKVCEQNLYCREIKWAGKKKQAYYYTEDEKRHYKHRCNLKE